MTASCTNFTDNIQLATELQYPWAGGISFELCAFP